MGLLQRKGVDVVLPQYPSAHKIMYFRYASETRPSSPSAPLNLPSRWERPMLPAMIRIVVFLISVVGYGLRTASCSRADLVIEYLALRQGQPRPDFSHGQTTRRSNSTLSGTPTVCARMSSLAARHLAPGSRVVHLLLEITAPLTVYARSDESSYTKVQVWLTNSTVDNLSHRPLLSIYSKDMMSDDSCLTL